MVWARSLGFHVWSWSKEDISIEDGVVKNLSSLACFTFYRSNQPISVDVWIHGKLTGRHSAVILYLHGFTHSQVVQDWTNFKNDLSKDSQISMIDFKSRNKFLASTTHPKFCGKWRSVLSPSENWIDYNRFLYPLWTRVGGWTQRTSTSPVIVPSLVSENNLFCQFWCHAFHPWVHWFDCPIGDIDDWVSILAAFSKTL